MLARISPNNQDFVRSGFTHRRNKGLSIGTLYSWIHTVAFADAALCGKPFKDVTPDELVGVISSLRKGRKESTVHLASIYLRQAWKEVLDVDQLPRAFARALEVREPRPATRDRIISPEEFQLLLQQAARLPGCLASLPHADQATAILWCLWDTGFRAHELLGLNIGDIAFDGTTGVRISMRKDAPRLKTGPRSVYVCECVSSLRILLAMHPWRHNLSAPLFPGFAVGKAGRMQYNTLNKFIRRMATASGVNARSGKGRVTSHTFRHSCATRKASNGWNEAQLRAFFGWENDSEMASHYVHLDLRNMKERVRRDAGLASRDSRPPDQNLEAVIGLLKKVLEIANRDSA